MGYQKELDAFSGPLIELYLKEPPEITWEEMVKKVMEKMEELDKKYAMPFYMV